MERFKGVIKKDFLIKDAINKMAGSHDNKFIAGMAVVVNDTNEVIGVLTDGDIRRGISKGISINDKVGKVANFNPVAVNKDLDKSQMAKCILDQCKKRNILLLGFLKRTGSTYLAERFSLGSIYDITILNSILSKNGQYIKPIPIVDQQSRNTDIHLDYVTFYLNLKSWNYRFELLKDQEKLFLECIENLLFWATDAYYGMNPIFSKADEHARVSKREANLRFNLIIHELPEKEQVRLRMNARKRTHFGLSNTFIKTLMEGNRKY